MSDTAALTIGTAISIAVLNEVLAQTTTNQLPNSANWQGWFVAGMTGIVALITAYYHDRRNELKLQVIELAEKQRRSAQKVEALKVAEQRLEPLSISHEEDERQVHLVEEQVEGDRKRITALNKENAELRALVDQLRNEINDLRVHIARLDLPDAPRQNPSSSDPDS